MGLETGAVPDWLSLGLGVVSFGRELSTGYNGVAVQANSISYHIGDYPASGTYVEKRIIHVVIAEVPTGDGAPYLAGLRRRSP